MQALSQLSYTPIASTSAFAFGSRRSSEISIIERFSNASQPREHGFAREELEHCIDRRRLRAAAHPHAQVQRQLRHLQAMLAECGLDRRSNRGLVPRDFGAPVAHMGDAGGPALVALSDRLAENA